ncbi:MAG: glycosyltransferase family 4 protein [Nitrospinota bacterium]
MSTRNSRIISSWPLDSGAGSGVARVASGLGRALEANGWDSELVSSDFSGEGYFSTTVKRILFNLNLRGESRLHDGRPVIAFDFDGFLLPKTVRFAQINGGILSDIVQFETGLVGQAVRLMARLEKLASMKADRIFTPSNYAAQKIRDLYDVPPEKISVMHNGIFFQEWRNRLAAVPRKQGRSPTVLSVARFYKRKGIDLLLKSWPIVLAKLPDARLSIVGDGLERENLKRLAEKLGINGSIDWKGTVLSDEEMASHYADCDVFCLPSRHESFGLVFIEAMASEKPVVAVNSTAVPEVVRDGIDGILAEPEDVNGIAAGIMTLLENSALRTKMGAEGAQRVRENFDFSRVITPLLDWMEERNAK